MSMWKRAMDYLGLGPDDPYDDYDVAPEPERPMRGQRQQPMRDEYDRGPAPGGGSGMGGGMGSGRAQRGYSQHDYEPEPQPPMRAAPSRPTFPSSSPDPNIRRPVPANDESTVHPRPINPRPSSPAVNRLAPASATAYSPPFCT